LSREPRRRDAAGRPPLLLLLHGIGSDEADLFGLAPLLDPRFHILSLRAPNRMPPGYAWYEVHFSVQGPTLRPEHVESSRRLLIRFLERAPEAYGADPERVYLLGFSQGAIMSLALTLTRPDLLAGVVAMSGRTLEELFQASGPLSGHLAPSDELQGFPLLVVHGRYDQVLPVDYGRETRRCFERLPVDLLYREYDMPHTITRESLDDIAGWLSRQLDRQGD
jgi:phospholipase/carboxylesterase